MRQGMDNLVRVKVLCGKENEEKNLSSNNSVGDPVEYHAVWTTVGESLEDTEIVETDFLPKLQRTVSSQWERASCWCLTVK